MIPTPKLLAHHLSSLDTSPHYPTASNHRFVFFHWIWILEQGFKPDKTISTISPDSSFHFVTTSPPASFHFPFTSLFLSLFSL
ncbi:hypothetical protein VNO80_20584 [Phaseolus coccineus]|uniref:Uncharacterized protein n=1 Tax=Phaseolus coccineus TaxID=3886 RepID=A0AAN9QTA5_PHACN